MPTRSGPLARRAGSAGAGRPPERKRCGMPVFSVSSIQRGIVAEQVPGPWAMTLIK